MKYNELPNWLGEEINQHFSRRIDAYLNTTACANCSYLPDRKVLFKFILDEYNQAREELGNLEFELSEEKVGFELFCSWNNHISRKHLLEDWTAKHIQTESKIMCGNLAKAICSNLKNLVRGK